MLAKPIEESSGVQILTGMAVQTSDQILGSQSYNSSKSFFQERIQSKSHVLHLYIYKKK